MLVAVQKFLEYGNLLYFLQRKTSEIVAIIDSSNEVCFNSKAL